MLKKILKIVGRTIIGLFVAVYIVVALLNYSVVQSFIGSVASNRLSEASGGTVRIGSIGCNPFNHLVLHNIELVTPDGDTVWTAGRVACRFSKFPVDQGINMNRVFLKDVHFHLHIDEKGLSIRYLTDLFKSKEKKEKKEKKSGSKFVVMVDDLRMVNVRYSQNLGPHKYLKEGEDSATYTTKKGIVKQKKRRKLHPGVADIPRMDYQNINGHFRNIRVEGDHITCKIDALSTVEATSGLVVENVSMNVFVSRSGLAATNMTLNTSDSRLVGDVMLDYKRWKTMSHYVDSVYMVCQFLPGSYGNPRDASFWTKALQGMDARVDIDGLFYGPVQNLHAEDVSLAFGEESQVKLDAQIYGLPKIDTTQITADIHKLHTTYKDLANVKHPDHIKMKAEGLVKELNNIDIEANFRGTIYDFRTQVALQSDIGKVDADVALSFNAKRKDYRYRGKVRAEGLRIGEIAPNEWLTRGSGEIEFKGQGFDPKTMVADAQGRIHNIVLKGQALEEPVSIQVDANDGKIGASLCIDDKPAKMTAEAEIEFRDAGPSYDLKADISRIDLAAFDIWRRDTVAILQANMHARYIPVSDKRIYARANIEDLQLTTESQQYALQTARVTLQEQNKYKTLTINSDIVNGQMRGYYEVGGIGQIVNQFVEEYWPREQGGDHMHTNTPNYDLIAGTKFDINLDWEDRTDILEFLIPTLKVANGTSLQVNYNFAESFKVLLRSDSIRYGNVEVNRVFLTGEPLAASHMGEVASSRYKVRLESSDISIGALLLSENVNFVGQLSHDEASAQVGWEAGMALGDANLNIRLLSDTSRMHIIVEPSTIDLGNQRWSLRDGGNSYFTDGKIVVDSLSLTNGTQSIVLSVVRQKQSDDEIGATFRNFALDIINPFIESSGINIDGAIDGFVSLTGMDNTPYMNAKIDIAELSVNEESIGDAHIESYWNAAQNQLNVILSTRQHREGTLLTQQPLWLSGYVAMGDNPEVDFDVIMDKFSISPLQPLVRSFSSKVEGVLDGELKVDGTLNAPNFNGYLYIDKGAINVDFLNVLYSFSDTVHMSNDTVELRAFTIQDPRGNTAKVDGFIHNKPDEGMVLDLHLTTDKLLCMNTRMQGNSYYGTVLASASGQVSGPLNDIDVTIDATTLPGSSLYIPISNNKQLNSADYIHFLSEEDILDERDTVTYHRYENNASGNKKVKSSRFGLTLNIHTTPDVVLNIPMTLPSVSVDIKTRGSGDLQMIVSSSTPFALIGDYEMEGGSMDVNLLGLLSKNFSIDEGSMINFPGEIADARYDIKAVYSQRVNMSSLTGTISSESQKQINVESVIELTGQLQDPTIGFDLRLPNADQSVQEEVFAYIDRNNERDMLNQTMSLLLLNRFYNSSTSSTETAGGNLIGEQGYSLIANSLGSIVSDMVDFVDINFDYKSGNNLITEQYAVDINKEWNKFYFESTLGYGGVAQEMSDVNNNVLTGDLLVGYKLNPQWHLFVFNRSNTNDYTRSDLPYKQGFGIKYTRSFDRFGELFHRKRQTSKKKKAEDKEQ